MSEKKLVVGAVVWVAYLWREQYDAGHDLGGKIRPCVIVADVKKGGERRLILGPITHTVQHDSVWVKLMRQEVMRCRLDPVNDCFLVVSDVNMISETRLRQELNRNEGFKRQPVGEVEHATVARAFGKLKAAEQQKMLRGVDLDKLEEVRKAGALKWRQQQRTDDKGPIK